MTRVPDRAALVAALTVGAVLVLAAGQTAPESQVTFRSAVDLVDVEVSVLDRYRLPVRGLSAADFTVLEEGQPRPLVAFTVVDLPPSVLPAAPWMEIPAPDVQSNSFAKEGRLVVILLDASIGPVDYPEARRIAEATVHQLRAGDMAAIAWSLPGIPQNFTADRQRLLDVIRQPILTVPDLVGGGSGVCPCGAGACAMEAIASIAEGVQEVGWRRKVLIFIGHRLPGRGGGCGGAAQSARTRALRAAEVGNLTIHVIDPQGVQTLAASASVRGRPPSRRLGAELRRVAALQAMTEPTEGRLVIRNQASEILPEVFRESNSYYVLGFSPAYARTDGRFRRITVKVNRPDVTLQARRGYYAAGRPPARVPSFGEGLPPILVEGIAGVWPQTDVGVSLSAAPVAVPGVRGGAVVVLARVRQDLTPNGPAPGRAPGPGPARETRVAVLTGAFDSNGHAHGIDRQTITVTPRQVGEGLFEYELVSRLELPPGRYEIRTAVEDSTLGLTGSAYTYVDVPDFAGELVSLSGMFLQAGAGAGPAPGSTT